MIRAVICHAIFLLAAAPVAVSQRSYFDKKAGINNTDVLIGGLNGTYSEH